MLRTKEPPLRICFHTIQTVHKIWTVAKDPVPFRGKAPNEESFQSLCYCIDLFQGKFTQICCKVEEVEFRERIAMARNET